MTSNDSAISRFEHHLLADIPLARAMALRVHAYDGTQLAIAAPLAPNRNDKGSAFGGSLVSLMTLAGWGLVVLHLQAAGRDCEVYVQDSQVKYLAPVWEDFAAHASLAPDQSWADFDAALQARGRARIAVSCRVPLAAGDACTLEARFVAIDKLRQNAASATGESS